MTWRAKLRWAIGTCLVARALDLVADELSDDGKTAFAAVMREMIDRLDTFKPSAGA